MTLVELLEDVYLKLTSSVELENLLGGIEKIYDFLPGSETPGPYVVIGDIQETEGRVLSAEERQVNLRIIIWSSYRGRSQCIAIARQIENILEKSDYIFESFDMNRDSEGWTQGILTFRIYIERRN